MINNIFFYIYKLHTSKLDFRWFLWICSFVFEHEFVWRINDAFVSLWIIVYDNCFLNVESITSSVTFHLYFKSFWPYLDWKNNQSFLHYWELCFYMFWVLSQKVAMSKNNVLMLDLLFLGPKHSQYFNVIVGLINTLILGLCWDTKKCRSED